MRFISWVPADRGRDRLSFRLRRPQRHPPLPDRRPVERPGAAEAPRRDGAPRGHRGGRDRPDLLDQRGAHARVLRRARRRAGRLRRHGPAVPEGPRRAAHPRRGPRAGAALCQRRPASGPSSSTATARSASRRSSTSRACRPASRSCTPRPARSRAAPPNPRSSAPPATSRRSGYAPPARPRGRGDRLRALRRAGAGQGPARPARRRSSTPPTTPTSSPAGWSRRRAGCSRSCAGRSCSTRCSRRSRASGPRWAIRSSSRPVSQFIASQAARNVIDGERWANVSDETVRYFLGHYGEPPAPVDPEIAERVLLATAGGEAPRARADQPRGARERFGAADLRGGAAAAPDDARGAGRRDASRRVRRAAADARGPPRARARS